MILVYTSSTIYRDWLKSGSVLLSKSQAEHGRKFMQPRDHSLAMYIQTKVTKEHINVRVAV